MSVRLGGVRSVRVSYGGRGMISRGKLFLILSHFPEGVNRKGRLSAAFPVIFRGLLFRGRQSMTRRRMMCSSVRMSRMTSSPTTAPRSTRV